MSQNNDIPGPASTKDTDAGMREPFRLLVHQLETLANTNFNRIQWMTDWFEPGRSIDNECGYPGTAQLTPSIYEDMYARESIARRVVQALPKESWKVHPVVYESEDPDKTTSFEDTWLGLGDNLQGEPSYYRGDEGNPLMEYFYRLDVEAGKGRYAVLFYGFDDRVADLSQPVTKDSKLLYLRIYSEANAEVSDLDETPGPRYGHPLYYTLKANNPSDYNAPSTPLRSINSDTTGRVHWSRVLHVPSDNVDTSEIYGTPRMQPVWNRLLDLRKLYAGSAEMYWKAGFGGYSLESPPGIDPRELKLDPQKIQAIKDNMEEFMNGLRRYILLIGLNAKSLAPQIVDPKSHIELQLQAIAMYLNMPMRVLMGSERGQLATLGDREEWNERLQARQRTFITPRILIPFINHLINVGVLAKPQKPKRSKFATKQLMPGLAAKNQPFKTSGGYTIFWPDMACQTSDEKANYAFKMSQALAVYAEKAVQWVMPPRPFFSTVIGLTEEEARNVEALSEEYNQEHGHDPAQSVAAPGQSPGTTIPIADITAQGGGNGQPVKQVPKTPTTAR
jgi:uncharacterized protein